MRNTAATSSLKLSGLATLGAVGHLTRPLVEQRKGDRRATRATN